MSTLFEALKNGTADLHEEIEKWMPVFREGFDRSAYRSHLECVYGFYRPVESELRRYLAGHEDPFEMPKRLKLEKLRTDLIALGHTDASLLTLPVAEDIKPINDQAELIGMLYVLEGSTLGGQLIKKNLKTRLDLNDDEINFYRGYDAATGPMWKAFREAAITKAHPEGEATSVDRARDTFQSYMQWLKRNFKADA